jgi:hypothetical protein
MRTRLKYITAMLAAGAAAVAAALAIGAAPMATADRTPVPSQPAPTTVTTTVTTAAAAPGPQDNQACTSSATSTKCQKLGDAEINAAIPAPYAGPYGIYGPFWAGSAG